MTENKKTKLKKIIKISVILILLLFVIFMARKAKSVYFNRKTINVEENNGNTIEKNELLEQKINDLVVKLDMKDNFIKNRIENLENNFLALQNDVSNIQKNIIELENRDPASSEKNIQLVVLLYKIKNVVFLGGDFSEYFNHLKILAKNKDAIFENVLKLEKYKLQKTQAELKKVFFGEYVRIISNNDENNNRITEFFKENIKIRKIANFDKSVDNTSLNIVDIENSIDKFDYKAAIELILQNKYENNFPNTLGILNEKSDVLKIVEEILDFVYGVGEL